jgi:hypothetical protein
MGREEIAWAGLSGLSLVLAAVLPASRATACSCVEYGEWGLVAPRGEAPENTRVWVTTEFGLVPELFDSQGALVETSESTLAVSTWSGRGTLFVLTPTEPLTPGERYGVATSEQGLGEFTVVAGSDRDAPEIPELVDVERTAKSTPGSSCGDEVRRLQLHYSSDTLVTLQFGDADELGTDPPSGEIGDLVLADAQGASFAYGGPCDPWPVDDRERFQVRVGAFDEAGNFSGWSEPSSFTRPRLDDSFLGCAAASVGRRALAPWLQWAAAALAVVGLLARRRVRARGSA